MHDIPIFGDLDAVPPRVGKLWLTGHKDHGSPDEGMGFFYRTLTDNPESFDDSQTGTGELRDYVLEHCSDPSPGFGSIIAAVIVYSNDGRPVPTDMADPAMGMIYMMAMDNFLAANEKTDATNIQMLIGDTLALSPTQRDVAWQWSAMRYDCKSWLPNPEGRWITHVAVRPQEGWIHLVRFTYPYRLDAGVGYRAFVRFLYEWQTSVSRVAAGEDSIAPLAIPEEEEWGAFLSALEEAPTPEGLIVRR